MERFKNGFLRRSNSQNNGKFMLHLRHPMPTSHMTITIFSQESSSIFVRLTFSGLDFAHLETNLTQFMSSA